MINPFKKKGFFVSDWYTIVPICLLSVFYGLRARIGLLVEIQYANQKVT
jgi:hypothetical protein